MTTILIVSDPHINSTVALCPPEFELDDGDTHHISPGQRWIWDNWMRCLDIASHVTDLVTVINGDAAEGDTKQRSRQLITRNKATIKRMAVTVLEPLVRMSKATYMTRGTPAHGGKSGEIEEDIADDLGLPGPTENTHSWWHLPLEADGRTFDIAHTMSVGGRLPWTAQNAANALAARTVMEYAARGERPPDFVVRAHIHRLGDSYDAFPTRALITPAWTLPTEYVTKIAPGCLADIGAIFINAECKDVWKYHPKTERRIWTKISYSQN